MSFIITKAQKAELRRRGYTEEQIREMKPEDPLFKSARISRFYN